MYKMKNEERRKGERHRERGDTRLKHLGGIYLDDQRDSFFLFFLSFLIQEAEDGGEDESRADGGPLSTLTGGWLRLGDLVVFLSACLDKVVKCILNRR